MKTSIRALHGIGNKTLPVVAAASLALLLQGCIDSKNDALGGGGPVDPGNPDPTVCSHLPVAQTSYKGGNTWGEELTVSLDPSTMAYTITIDASLQRTAGTTRSGTLTPLQQECAYSSDESGAVFTLAPNGVLQGGINAPSGSAFAALLAFRNTWNNAADPAVFNPVAEIHNLIGVQSDGTAQQSYAGSGRLRNAGSYQLCRDPVTSRFIVYAAGCAVTVRGYITYVAARDAFDLYITPGTNAATTGGTLSGSMIIGLVGSGTNEKSVPLHLVRESATSYGMRLYTPQPQAPNTTPPPPAFDGSYAIIDSDGSNAAATLTGTDYSRNAVAATLTYGAPVAGVLEATGALSGSLLSNGGILGFIPASGAPAFELGVLN